MARAIDPGEEYTRSTPAINDLYDMTLPGKYTVVVQMIAAEEGANEFTSISSNPIKIVILERYLPLEETVETASRSETQSTEESTGEDAQVEDAPDAAEPLPESGQETHQSE